MPTVKREGLPEFWATRIAKVLVGEQPCLLEPWLMGHYKLEKRPREDNGKLVEWKVNHTEQLRAEVQRFKDSGWKCSVERFFKVTGTYAVLTGKCDLVAQAPDKRPLIVDVKSGSPRDSDAAQVLIEMIAIPMAWDVRMQFAGRVVYPTHTLELTPSDAEALKPKVFALLKRLGTMERPEASPSGSACRFCDVNETDCPDRFDEAKEPTTAGAEGLF